MPAIQSYHLFAASLLLALTTAAGGRDNTNVRRTSRRPACRPRK
jgi:hypothetical protein